MLGKIGEGGLATVYRVRHASLGTEFALKVLKQNSAQLRARLLQEGRIQARLRHPNVVAVTDVVDIDGHVGLVMELVEGPTLRDVLDEGKPLPLADALSLFRQVLDGVGAAHREGILHRDLKPDNVLLAVERRRVVAKITDFGVAKAGVEPSVGPLTRAGVMLGTPGYMAPEQALDAARTDMRADIFSLGALLHELVSGRPAFDGHDTLAVLNAAAQGQFKPLTELVPSCPASIAAAVARALSPDPAQRFPECDSFARALGDVASDARFALPVARAEVPTTPDAPSPIAQDAPLVNPTIAPAPEEIERPTEPGVPRRVTPVVRPRVRRQGARHVRTTSRRQRWSHLRARAAALARAVVRGGKWATRYVALPALVVAALGASWLVAVEAYASEVREIATAARADVVATVPQHLALAHDLGMTDRAERLERASSDAERLAEARGLYEAMTREMALRPLPATQAEAVQRRAMTRELARLGGTWAVLDTAEKQAEGVLDGVEVGLSSWLAER